MKLENNNSQTMNVVICSCDRKTCRQHVIFFLFLFVLVGCASIKHVNVITQKKNDLQHLELPKLAALLGGTRDVVFTVKNEDLTVEYSKQKLEPSDIADIKMQYQNRPEDVQIGCIKINENSFEVCPNDLPYDVFSIKNVTATYKIEDIDTSLVQAIGEIVSKKIFIEFKEIESYCDVRNLEEFIKKHDITDAKTQPYMLLLSLYRESDNYNAFIKAYKLSKERSDLDRAYKVAGEEYQKKEVEDIMAQQTQSDLRALAGSMVEGVKKRFLGKGAKRAESATVPACSSIKNIDIQSLCIAETNSDYSCFSINNNDLQNLCVAKIDAGYSCALIKDEDIKNLCLATTTTDYSCFSIKNEEMRNYCLSQTRSDYSCVSIRNEDIRILCQVKAK